MELAEQCFIHPLGTGSIVQERVANMIEPGCRAGADNTVATSIAERSSTMMPVFHGAGGGGVAVHSQT